MKKYNIQNIHIMLASKFLWRAQTDWLRERLWNDLFCVKWDI